MEPVCYNHPNVVSYINCQRCQRPICATCQVPAAVGFQCQSCVTTGGKAQFSAQRTAQRKIAVANLTGGAVVTKSLIAGNIFVYLIQLALGWENFTLKYLFVPLLATDEPYRFITAGFLHSVSPPLIHVGMNMLVLWMVGPLVEQLLGKLKFTLIYFMSIIGGHAVILLLSTPNLTGSLDDWVTPTVGASGAVFGLFGAAAVLLRHQPQQFKSFATLILINFMIGFFLQNVSWQGHLGGVLTGAALAALYSQPAVRKSPGLLVGATLAVAAVLGILVQLGESWLR